MDFLYDENGAPLGLDYNGTRYYYITNLEGDIVKIINQSGVEVVEYTYDGWGVPTVSGSLASTLGQDNPYRFKGYYYDVESGMYYLQSRYYDPVVGRFVNADDTNILEVQSDLYDKNLFAYCDNDPINRKDEYGDLWQVAVVGGGVINIGSGISLGAISGYIVTGLGAITPVGWTIIGTAAIIGGVYMIYQMAKGGKQNIRDTGLIGLSKEELNAIYKNPNTSKKEKKRIEKQQKADRDRNAQKRENNNKNSGKKKKR